MEERIVIEFFKLFQNTPNAVLLIAFCLVGIKKYVINGNMQKFFEYQKQRNEANERILQSLNQMKDLLAAIGNQHNT